MVCPTNWGNITDARLQVRMTFLSPAAFIFSTLASSLGSTKGPFLRLRDISASSKSQHGLGLPTALRGATAHNVLIGALVTARLLAQGRLAPGRLGPRHTDRRAAFTTAVRMRVGVHRGTTYRR